MAKEAKTTAMVLNCIFRDSSCRSVTVTVSDPVLSIFLLPAESIRLLDERVCSKKND